MRVKLHFFAGVSIGVTSIFLLVSPVFAHVIIYPHQVGLAATQDFTVSVPNEKNTSVVSVRLLIPSGLSDVSPNTTAGWPITTKAKGHGDSVVISEIDLSNGSIPAGQREEFIFQAKVPPMPTTLAWKAYQTYSDGTVVSWDVNPATMSNVSDAQQDQLADKENKGVYSTTQVINDLSASNDVTNALHATSNDAQVAEILSSFAFLIALAALYLGLKKKKETH